MPLWARDWCVCARGFVIAAAQGRGRCCCFFGLFGGLGDGVLEGGSCDMAGGDDGMRILFGLEGWGLAGRGFWGGGEIGGCW